MPLEIGKIVNTHGLKGEVKIMPWCNSASTFLLLDTFITKEKSLKVEKARLHKNTVIIKFFGVDSIDDANKLRGEILYVNREQLGELSQGTYYIADLIGAKVFEQDEFIGLFEDCFNTGSNDVYLIRKEDGSELLIPALSSVIKSIDVDNRRIDIYPYSTN
ncbi:MAG: 16S rRNA processing protein RimM [Clostridiaceae bacterium]|nr:16S rRNA processing protein RimM [Clostridiaceae bacterium]